MNRPNSAHGWLTPVEFVEAWLAQQQLLLAWRVDRQAGSPHHQPGLDWRNRVRSAWVLLSHTAPNQQPHDPVARTNMGVSLHASGDNRRPRCLPRSTVARFRAVRVRDPGLLLFTFVGPQITTGSSEFDYPVDSLSPEYSGTVL